MSTVDVTDLSSVPYTEEQQTHVMYTLSTDPSNIVLELVDLDVSGTLALDPSFEELVGLQAGIVADAVMELDVSLSKFQGLFGVHLDSRDINDISADDVIYRVNPANDNTNNDVSGSLPVSDQFANIVYSSSTVKASMINSTYQPADQVVKKDFIRHIAKAITGGYAAADIFTNEAQLQQGVVDLDDDISNALSALVVDVSGDKDSPNNMIQAARNLFQLNLQSTDQGQAGNSRSDKLLNDISGAGGSATEGIVIPLRFEQNDRIAVKITYHPASATFAGNGVSVPSRSYKLYLKLV